MTDQPESERQWKYVAEIDERGGDIMLSAPDERELLSAAASSAVVAADHIRRFHVGSELAAMFDTAGRFVNDVFKRDTIIGSMEDATDNSKPDPARGQMADLYLLEMASLWMAVSHEEGNDFYEAALFLRDIRTSLDQKYALESENVPDGLKSAHRFESHRE